MDRDRASRLIGLLLWLYPKDFRRRFGHGMRADLEDWYSEISRSADPSKLRWFWLTTAWDTITLASVEYYETMKGYMHRSPRSDHSPANSIRRAAPPLEQVIYDIRHATRLLVKDPFVSGIAVLTFALGIALFATTFSIVYGSTWRGLPFEDPDELVHFERANPSQGLQLAVTPHDYMGWKEQQLSFEGLAAFVEAYINLADAAGPAEPQTGVYIEAEAFRLLRVQPLLGRIFRPAEHAIDGPRAILLSHGLWQSRYGGDSSIVGQTIRVTEEVSAEYSVVGVMPEGFGFPIAEEFWLPLRLDMNRIERGSGRLDVFGRLKSDVTFERMEAEFAAISLRLEREFPQTNTGIVAAPATFHDEYIGAEFTNRVRAMLAGSILVLLIACINVTNLLLARTTRRRKEIAVRTALGAGRRRVISMILTETTLLAAIGAVLGIAAAFYGTQRFGAALVNAGALRLPHGGDSLFWWEFKVDTVPMLTAIAAAAVCGALAGLIPAIQASGARVSEVLKEESGKMSRSGFRRLGNALVTVEIALTMGLLVATGLTVRSVLKLRNADYAFEIDQILTARVGLWGERYSRDRAARTQF